MSLSSLKSGILANKIEISILALLAMVFFWNLGAHPPWFDHVVAQSIWPQVNQVFDGAPHPLQGVARWQWQDMYQHNAGLSPLYGELVRLGMSLGGLNLLAVRLPQSILTLLVLSLAYVVLRKRIGQREALVFAVLLGTSPWFLLGMRSGGIIGFGCMALILTLSLISLLFPSMQQWTKPWPQAKNASPWLAILAGFSVSLLPYAHSSTRMTAVVLMIGVPVCYRLIGIRAAVAFVAGAAPLLLLQLTNLPQAMQVYFHARGETLFQVAATYGSPEAARAFMAQKLTENVQNLSKLLFGLNEPQVWFNNNIAYVYWSADEVLYPKFLAPFFLLGLGVSFWRILRERSPGHLILIIGFLLTIVPGLMSGMGVPNQARLFLAVIPIYLLITLALLFFYEHLPLPKKLLAALGATMVGLIALYQVHNFFFYEKGGVDEKHAYAQLMQAYNEKLQICPDALFVLHEFPEFDIYRYVTIRWRGGEALAQALRDKHTWLLSGQNAEELRRIMTERSKVVLISAKYRIEKAQNFLADSMPPSETTAYSDILIYTRGCP